MIQIIAACKENIDLNIFKLDISRKICSVKFLFNSAHISKYLQSKRSVWYVQTLKRNFKVNADLI